MRWQAVVTWLASTGIALMGYAGWYTLTTVPAVDATLAAILIHARPDLSRQAGGRVGETGSPRAPGG